MVRFPELPAGRYSEIWLAWLPAGRSLLPRLTWSSPGPPELPVGGSPDSRGSLLSMLTMSSPEPSKLPAWMSPDPLRSQLAAGRSRGRYMRILGACKFLIYVSVYKLCNTTTSANIAFKTLLLGVPKKYRKKGTVTIFTKSF